MPEGNQGGSQSTEGTGEGTGQENPQPETFEVVINGESRQVSQADLIAGYQKGEDYTQKTQSLSKERERLNELVEEKATELYMAALKEQEGTENQSTDDSGKSDADKMAARVSELESRLSESEQTRTDEADDKHLKSVLDPLKEEFPHMDRDKVLIEFYNSAKEADDIPAKFKELAKASHDGYLAQKQAIIDEYVKAKSVNPFSKGENGMSTTPNEKKVEPPKTFLEARERAWQRLHPNG